MADDNTLRNNLEELKQTELKIENSFDRLNDVVNANETMAVSYI